MIVIANKELSPVDLAAKFDENNVEIKIVNILSSSSHQYTYASFYELKFELELRKEIIKSSYQLNQSGLNFAVFRKTKCNAAYWNRARNGGFVLRNNVKPRDAILDIYINGSEYGTECATAMMIIYYKALLEVYSERIFNKVFSNITLMNFHQIHPLLREVGMLLQRADCFPGDRRYFNNPDVNPLTPQWQGENVIDLGNGLYYGHGVGIRKADEIIQALNEHRSETADESAVLLNSVGRPSFENLENFRHYFN